MDPRNFENRSTPMFALARFSCLYCQKLEPLTYIFAVDSMGLYLLLLTRLFLQVKRSESRMLAENGPGHEIVTGGHSFCIGRHGPAYRH